MENLLHTIKNSYTGYARYLWHAINNPSWDNYFYWLLAVSFLFLALEWISPWRKNQARFRKDFWLDFFYLFFNPSHAASHLIHPLLGLIEAGKPTSSLVKDLVRYPTWRIRHRSFH